MRVNAMPRVVRTLLLLLSPPALMGLALGTMGILPIGAASSPLAAARFAIIGDYGSAGQSELDVSNRIHGWNPDFIITTGDNNYDLGAASTIDPNIGQYYHDFI